MKTPEPDNDTTMICVQVTRDMKRDLQTVAQHRDTDVSKYVRALIRRDLKRRGYAEAAA